MHSIDRLHLEGSVAKVRLIVREERIGPCQADGVRHHGSHEQYHSLYKNSGSRLRKAVSREFCFLRTDGPTNACKRLYDPAMSPSCPYIKARSLSTSVIETLSSSRLFLLYCVPFYTNLRLSCHSSTYELLRIACLPKRAVTGSLQFVQDTAGKLASYRASCRLPTRTICIQKVLLSTTLTSFERKEQNYSLCRAT